MVAQTRAEALASSIELSIRERSLAPGDLIGTMDELRDSSGYGRATISEAARLLADRGVAEVRPGRGGGLFVAQANPVVRLRHTLLTVREKPTTVADAIAVRDALEPLIATEAALHRTRADITDLRKHLTAMRRATSDYDRFLRTNWALHTRIAQIGENHLAKAVYLSMSQCITDLSARATFDGEAPTDEYMNIRLEHHTELVEAIASGDVPRTLAAVESHRSPSYAATDQPA